MADGRLEPHVKLATKSQSKRILITSPTDDRVSDYLGRKSTLISSIALNALGGLISAFSPDLYWLAAFRVIAGIGMQ